MIHRIGILHPGEMGSAVAATLVNSGMQVGWCSNDRSAATRARAEALGLTAHTSLQALCDNSDLVISVCPPHAAIAQAEAVLACGYQGIYADINAIAPATMQQIASSLTATGISVIDGGIIGLPPVARGTTWLYLSGPGAEQLGPCFKAGPMEVKVLGRKIGQASGLKMCFAANSKGTAAMHTAILGAAEAMGVREALEQQWDIYTPGFTAKTHSRIRQVARKAWRFTGEMQEIASTLATCGMPPAFHQGAADIYERQAEFKDTAEEPSMAEILAALRSETDD
ncbi:MAG: DUF1932 domain-containing protein [Pseudohongiellaceae bacterium]